MTTYKDLIVWQKSLKLVLSVYTLAGGFPKDELYGLTSQMRRAAVSMPSNIAEGRRRGTDKEFRRFLAIAYASGAELETQIEIIKLLQYGKVTEIQQCEDLLSEVMKILNKMIHSLHSYVLKATS